MKTDYDWLLKWAPYLTGKKVLELGCGPGIDSLKIASLAETLTACDLNPILIQHENVITMTLDHSETLPFSNGEFDVVVASLCLHYFSWDNTHEIIKEVSRVLADDGVLICRLNSEKDIYHGALGYSEIEPGLYDVKGAPKRFFTQKDVMTFLDSQWELMTLEHKTIDRYKLPKSIWELAVIKL